MEHDLTVIVLAAGGGTRMRSKTVKLLHRIGGRTLVGHVLHTVSQVGADRVVAVVGTQAEEVRAHIADVAPQTRIAVQPVATRSGPVVPYGTGYAVRVGIEALDPGDLKAEGTVLVLMGDAPMLEAESLRAFVDEHSAAERVVSILSAELADPTGYGRIVRNAENDVEAIVEEKDADRDQRAITEVSSGILAFDAEFLLDVLPKLHNDNAKGEYYLTDTVGFARDAGLTVGAHLLGDREQTEGANDRVQLAELGRKLNRRILERWMREGVTVMDPATTWVDADVTLAPDVTLLPGVQLLGSTVVAEDAVIGPDCTLQDCEIGEGARVVRTHGQLAVVGAGANVGPFAYLRPNTELGADGKIGTFVETKNARIGEGAKVPHLSYVGDAEIGERTNIGAGTIFANYDGVAKHRTVVGRYARTGSNNTFVAPVTIGDGAATGGGSVIRDDVPPGALAVSQPAQRNLVGWTLRRRAGTPQADAAARAVSTDDVSDSRSDSPTGDRSDGPTDGPGAAPGGAGDS